MEEIFARTLEVVSETTDVSSELILSKDRHEEVVDARYLLDNAINPPEYAEINDIVDKNF